MVQAALWHRVTAVPCHFLSFLCCWSLCVSLSRCQWCPVTPCCFGAVFPSLPKAAHSSLPKLLPPSMPRCCCCVACLGQGSYSLCWGCAVAQEASDHLHNPHKIKHLAVVLGFLLVLEQNQARCGSIPGCVTSLSPPRASVSLSALPFSCSASKG